jgi:hypothetical protein
MIPRAGSTLLGRSESIGVSGWAGVLATNNGPSTRFTWSRRDRLSTPLLRQFRLAPVCYETRPSLRDLDRLRHSPSAEALGYYPPPLWGGFAAGSIRETRKPSAAKAAHV